MLKTDTVHFFVMTRDAKMVAEGTFEPCEKGDNDPAVQRSLSIWSDVSSLNMTTFKISKCKNDCLEGLNKAVSDVTEHQISLRKSSKDNNID